MSAIVSVNNLGDDELEKRIAIRISEIMAGYGDKWRITVLGSAGRDIWEIKVQHADGPLQRVRELVAHQTIERVVEEALAMVRSIERNEVQAS